MAAVELISARRKLSKPARHDLLENFLLAEEGSLRASFLLADNSRVHIVCDINRGAGVASVLVAGFGVAILGIAARVLIHGDIVADASALSGSLAVPVADANRVRVGGACPSVVIVLGRSHVNIGAGDGGGGH